MTRLRVPSLRSGSARLWSLIFCLTCGVSGVQAQLGNEARLRDLVERFFASYQKEDLEGLISMWSQKSPDVASSRLKLQQTFAQNDRIELKNLAIQKNALESGKASIRVAIDMSAVEARTGKPAATSGRMNRTLHFVQEGDEWKVWKFSVSEEDFAAALVRVDNEAERAALLETEKELQTGDLVRALLAEGRRQQEAKARYQQAQAVYEFALKLAERLGDKAGAARSLMHIGVAYKMQGDSARALELLQRSLKVSTEAGDNLGTASVLGTTGLFYSQEGDYPQALASYRSGLSHAEALNDRTLISRFLNSIGVVYWEQGDYGKSLEHHQRNLKIIEESGDKAQLAACLGNIGLVYDSQGNYSRALEYYQKSLKLKEERGDRLGIARSLNNLGIVYRMQGNSTQALEYLQRSLKIKEELGNKLETVSTLSNIGEVLTREGDYTRALDYLQRSLKLNEELRDQVSQAQTLGNLGILSGLQGNHAAAIDYLQRTLKINQTLGDKAGIAATLNNIGEVHFSQGSYAQAAELFDEAATLARQIDLAELVWLANALSGRAHQRLHRPDQARQRFLTAIDTIEQLRGQVGGGEQERQRSFENRLAAYHGLIDLLVDEQNATEALLYAERAKSRVLLDVLQDGRIDITRAMNGEEQERERKIRGEAVSLNVALHREKLQATPNKARLSDLETRLQKTRLEYEALQTALYATHPELKVQRGRMKPLAASEVVRLMPDRRTALVEFVVQEDRTLMFVMTAKGTADAKVDLKVYPLNATRKQLAELTNRFRRNLAERRLNLQELSMQLYGLLLKPARGQLQGIDSLIIVPDDVLWHLPFQALQQPNNRYLIEDYAISFAPSLTVLREMMKQQPLRANPAKASPTLLAFGNPALASQTVGRAKAVLMDEPLEPLPEAEKQVKLLGQLYGQRESMIYTGSSAQEERFKNEAGDYRILHLATHGIVNNVNPMYSQLVLAAASDAKAREDGLLEAWEIMNLNLKADLVVLSACETARGRVGAGEGIIGLTWALFVAGAPTVVVSQWKVEAASNTTLMIEFHKHLRNSLQRAGTRYDSAAALREASLKMLRSRKYEHPFYWAPFVTIGNGRGSRLVDGS